MTSASVGTASLHGFWTAMKRNGQAPFTKRGTRCVSNREESISCAVEVAPKPESVDAPFLQCVNLLVASNFGWKDNSSSTEHKFYHRNPSDLLLVFHITVDN